MKRRKILIIAALVLVAAVVSFLVSHLESDNMRREAEFYLQEIYSQQKLYLNENRQYATTFSQIAWFPEGRPFYSYYLGDDVIHCDESHYDDTCPPPNYRVPSDKNEFVAAATAKYDGHTQCDVLIIDQTGKITVLVDENDHFYHFRFYQHK